MENRELCLIKQIKVLMGENDLSQIEFAFLIGVGGPVVSYWLKGRHYPSLQVVAEICRVFNVSADWLLFGDGEYTGSKVDKPTLTARILAAAVL